MRLNTYDNLCGTEQELLTWFSNNVYKGRTLIGIQPAEQLQKIAETKERTGLVGFFFQDSNGNNKLETIFVGIN